VLTYKEMTRIIRGVGVTKQDAYRARQLAKLSNGEFEAHLTRRKRG
jgi:hypothetical protein